MNRTQTQHTTHMAQDLAISVFKKNHGILNTSEAIQQGIHPRTLYCMRDHGLIEQMARGLFHLTKSVEISNIDLVTVAKKVPRGIICLISALDFYDLTTQIPHFVDIAYRRDWRAPTLEFPPIKIYRYSERSYNSGIEHHVIDGVNVSIYSQEKTIADCFKFRNKIGSNVAIEALKRYCEKGKPNLSLIIKYAKICRVDKIIRPYLEGVINE